MKELVTYGYITNKQLEAAEDYRKKYGCKIGIALLELGFITAKDMESFAEEILKTI